MQEQRVAHYAARTYSARTSIGYQIKRAYAQILDYVQSAFTQQGYTFMQWIVLIYLRDGLVKNPCDLSREFNYNSGALTRLIDTLEGQGLLERRRSTVDRRTVELALTAAGQAQVEALVPIVVDRLNDALSDFSEAEVAEFGRLLRKLNSGLDERTRNAAVAAREKAA
jgi:DNA-binding MarR family transcriptional regulator